MYIIKDVLPSLTILTTNCLQLDHLKERIEFATAMIRENRIDYARLKKELNELLLEFETPAGLEY